MTEAGEATTAEVALRPVPLRVTVTAPMTDPVDTFTVSDPEFVPIEFGVKVTGTLIEFPGCSVAPDAPKLGLGLPIVNADPEDEKDVTVVVDVAVNVAVPTVDCDTVVGEKLTLLPVIGGTDEVKPNPKRCPSAVPT